MVGKGNNRKRAAEHFQNFSQLLQLLKNVNRNTSLQRKGTEIATFLPIAAGKFSLLSYWLLAGIWAFPNGFPISFKNFPRGCPKAFGHFPAAILYPFSSTQWLSNSL
jgi:hypothetical protein